MRLYTCDHCGAIVEEERDLEYVALWPSRAEADEKHAPFWEGDLCKECKRLLIVMRSRAVSNAEWRFSLNQDTIEEEYR